MVYLLLQQSMMKMKVVMLIDFCGIDTNFVHLETRSMLF